MIVGLAIGTERPIRRPGIFRRFFLAQAVQIQQGYLRVGRVRIVEIAEEDGLVLVAVDLPVHNIGPVGGAAEEMPVHETNPAEELEVVRLERLGLVALRAQAMHECCERQPGCRSG